MSSGPVMKTSNLAATFLAKGLPFLMPQVGTVHTVALDYRYMDSNNHFNRLGTS